MRAKDTRAASGILPSNVDDPRFAIERDLDTRPRADWNARSALAAETPEPEEAFEMAAPWSPVGSSVFQSLLETAANLIGELLETAGNLIGELLSHAHIGH